MRMVGGTNQHALAPRVTCIALHEFGTGKQIWKRETNWSGPVSLVSTQSGLVLMTANVLHSFDAATGSERWSLKLNAAASAVDEGGNYAVLWTREKKEGKDAEESLMAVGLADGKVRWNELIPDGFAADPRELFIAGKRVLAIGKGAALYSLETGNREAQDLPPFTPPVKHVALKDALVLGDKIGRLVCVRSDGTVLWKTVLSGPIDHLSSDGDDLLAASAPGALMDLHLLSLRTGKQLWTHQDELLSGNPVFTGRLLVYSAKGRVVILDRASGGELGAAQRSDAMRQARLPDRLLVYDDQVTAVGETGAVAVSTGGKRKPGDVLWRIDFRGTDVSNLAARQDQARRAAYNSGFTPAYGARSESQSADKMLADAKLFEQLQYNVFLPMADYQSSLTRNEIKALGEAGTTQNKYSGLSAGQRLQLTNAYIASEKAQAQMKFSSALFGLAVSQAGQFFANLERMTSELYTAQVMRSQAALQRALELWALSLQGDHIIRPIGWEFGQGALVVNSRTGNWIEIITGPGEPAVQDFHIQYPPAILSPDGRRLFTLAHNGNPGLPEFPTFIVAGRSAASFVLPDRAAWNSPQDYLHKSLAPKSIVEMGVPSK